MQTDNNAKRVGEVTGSDEFIGLPAKESKHTNQIATKSDEAKVIPQTAAKPTASAPSTRQIRRSESEERGKLQLPRSPKPRQAAKVKVLKAGHLTTIWAKT